MKLKIVLVIGLALVNAGHAFAITPKEAVRIAHRVMSTHSKPNGVSDSNTKPFVRLKSQVLPEDSYVVSFISNGNTTFDECHFDVVVAERTGSIVDKIVETKSGRFWTEGFTSKEWGCFFYDNETY